MKIMKVLWLAGLFLVLWASPSAFEAAEVNKKSGDQTKKSSLNKPTQIQRQLFDVNTISAWFRNDGEFYYDHVGSGAGFAWPKAGPGIAGFNAAEKAIFSSSMWIGAKVDGQVRVATVGHGASELRPGLIDPVTKKPDDPNKAENRTFIVRPTLPEAADYLADYNAWPVNQGAPADAGGKPALMWGGEAQRPDMLMYCTYNDANNAFHTHQWGKTLPLGAEVRQTVWAYDRTGAFGQMQFIRFEVRNLSDKTWNDTYFSVWSDPDLGDANDDLVAVDRARNLGVTYNATNNDVRYGAAPPAVGYVFFQGPIVAAAGDTALVSGSKIPGYRNLGMSSFNMYINPSVVQGFPDPNDGIESYNYMQGFKFDGSEWIDPTTNQVSKFVVSGDPVARTGWLDGGNPPSSGPPSDRRILLTTGPFTMAPGEVQQVVVGVIVARGSNNFDSITRLRAFTDASQKLFDLNFKLPPSPPTPKVKVTFDDDSDKLILTWGTESESYFNSDFNLGFHGYNVYFAPSLTSPPEDFVRIGSFYKRGGPSQVQDLKEFEGLPDPVLAPIWQGTSEGVRNFVVLDVDPIAKQRFTPGVPYYIAVTAFAINPNAVEGLGLRYLENSLSTSIFSFTPQRPVAGTVLPNQLDQVVAHNRVNDDAVRPLVVDPWHTTDRKFRVAFNGDSTNVTSWSLQDATSGNTLATSTNFSGDDAYPLVDGLIHKVIRNPVGVRRDDQTPVGWQYTPAGNQWFSARNTTGERFWRPAPRAFDALEGALTYPTSATNPFRSGLPATRLRRVEIRFSSQTTQKAYRFVNKATAATPLADPSFADFMQNRGAGWVYQDYRKSPKDDANLGVTVPFTVWEKDPLYGTERQLNVGFIETNDSLAAGYGKVDGRWLPTAAPEGGGEVLVIFASTYDENALSQYTGANFLVTQVRADVMYLLWVRANDAGATFKNGDVFAIQPNYPFFANRTTFEYAGGAPQVAMAEVAKERGELNMIKAVPNPYYGLHRLQQDAFDRYITFQNLPRQATIRIFNLAGQLVKVLEHNAAGGDVTGSLERWDLTNHQNLPVASGLYLAHINAPNIGEKVVKLVVFLQEERLDLF